MKLVEEKIVQRIDQLLAKAERVKATHKPNPPNVIGFPTLNSDAFFEWHANAENLILRVTGKDSSYYKSFTKQVKRGFSSHVNSGIGILKAMKEDLQEGLLSDVHELVLAEVFSDFVDMASHLLEAGYKDPSASLSGAVLEDGLRKIAVKEGIKVKDSDDIAALNTKLADKGIYNRLIQKQIQVWKGIRDSADHGKFDLYKKSDVEAMIKGVRQFLAENL